LSGGFNSLLQVITSLLEVQGSTNQELVENFCSGLCQLLQIAHFSHIYAFHLHFPLLNRTLFATFVKPASFLTYPTIKYHKSDKYIQTWYTASLHTRYTSAPWYEYFTDKET